MKKIITICLLVVTLFVGGMTIDAKTTKKKSKAKITSPVKTETYTEFEKQFLLPSELVQKWKGKYWLNSNENILKYLKKKGFKITYDPSYTEWESAYKEAINPKTGKKYSFHIEWSCGAHLSQVFINFATKEDAKEFYNKIKIYNNKVEGWHLDLSENSVCYDWM